MNFNADISILLVEDDENLGFVIVKKYESKLKNKYSYVPNHFRMELKN